MPLFPTACPRNCYSSCSFLARIEEGRLAGIEPNPANLATAEGPCLKGLSYVERAHSPDRILYPMHKNSRGGFDRIPWDHALEVIAAKLVHLRSTDGPHAVLFYESSGMAGLTNEFSSRFWELFGGASTTYGNLCWPAGLEAVRLTLGENKHNLPWDLQNSKLIILWGKNPAETNIHQMVFIEKAASQGAKVIVIDPRRTPSSERADLLIQPKPGTDAAIALSVANYLVQTGQFDKQFVEDHVAGFESFAGSIANWTFAKASAISGVPIELIEEMARDIATVKPMTLIPGYGMQRFSNGGQTIRTLLALSILTGNIGKKGACFHYANLQSYVFDKLKEPLSYYPSVDANPIFRRIISKASLGKDIIESRSPGIKMIWVERGNPVSQNPDSNLTLQALRKLDFRVVVDQFMTDTAQEADIILPAKNMFEQADIIGCYWHSYIQYKAKLMDSPGEIKPETEIYYLLAQKLGFSQAEIQKHLPLPGEEHIERFLKNKADNVRNLDWEALVREPQLTPGLEEIAFEDMIFKTPSGKIELLSAEAAERWKVGPLPAYTPIAGSDPRFPLLLLTPNTKNRIHSQFGNLQIIRQFDPEPKAVISAHEAVEKNINPNDLIRIFNMTGTLTVKTDISFSLRPGCIVYFNGYWNLEGGSPNLLTKGGETDMGHGAAFHDTWVQIEKL